MKKIAILFIVLLTSSFVFAQNTYVPDDKFEQALIDLGYDTTLDDSVVTANISGVTTLDVSEKEISDLTGIEAFSALTSLECWSNKITSLDMTANTALTNLNCWNNKLTSLDVSKNTALDYLSLYKNQLTSLDLSQNIKLKVLYVSENKLTSLNMRNGIKDALITFFAQENPGLTCIEVLDPVWATANWTNADVTKMEMDAGVTFAYICGVDVDGVSTYNNNGIKAITFNVELPVHSLPDTDISLGFWKSGAENHECTGCNGRDTVSMRKLSDDHWEATVGLDTTLVAGETGESQYWYHYFKTIPDYTIPDTFAVKEDLERFKSEPNPDGLRQLEPSWHKVSPLVNKDTVVAWNNIAPVSFDWVSKAADTIKISKTNLGETYELKWSESIDVDIDTIDYLVYAKIGVYPEKEIYDTTVIALPLSYQEIVEIVFEGKPNEKATVQFTIFATDGIDTVRITGDDRVLFVNRYEYLSTEGEGIPTEFALHDNYPNPFNPTTTLRFDLPEVSDITVTIFNMLGQKVRTFNMNNTPAGYHSIKWNATNNFGDPVGAGVYLYQLRAGNFVKTKKMILLK
ncbi:MAG: T9SS type A sorting domain-containing protein [Candidatus Marinimicrobia bacterium]|nr:T9SS type A sorting domain-containing protein [Candidatus Neomarinimicrobiota bacterium]